MLKGIFIAASLFALAQAPVHAQAAFTEEPAILQRGEVQLHGSLMLPAAVSAKPPVALLIAGSGPTDRDGNAVGQPGKNMSLQLLARALADAGIASLRYDKRGIAASAAAGVREIDLRFETYADDAAAWVAQLGRDPRFSAVVLIGHSEGATLGLLAAQRGGVAAYVSLAGPGRDATAVLRSQLKGKLPPDLAEQNEQILQALQDGRTADHVPAPLAALYRPSVQPYLISWFRVDPARAIAALTMPLAIIQGGTDIQVSLDDAQRLKAAAPASAQLIVIPGMNHVLKRVPAEQRAQIASYADPSLPLDPDLVQGLTGFLKRSLAIHAGVQR